MQGKTEYDVLNIPTNSAFGIELRSKCKVATNKEISIAI